MSSTNNLLQHTIGTDSTFLFPCITTDEEGFAAALAIDPDADIADFQTPTDISGAFFYFQICDAAGGNILSKDNDPAGVNVGITLRVPETDGIVEVRVANSDLPGATPGDRLPYAALLRRDPSGADVQRDEVTEGAIEVVAAKILVP